MSRKTRKTLKLALVGGHGRMGQALQTLIQADAQLELSAVIGPAAEPWKSLRPELVDVVIDFSAPPGLAATLKWCTKNRCPLVCGTTGLTPKQRLSLKTAAKKIPVLYSANMSLGIAVLSAMLTQLKDLPGWDFQIEEAHHVHKKDSPSGTALLLQTHLQDTLGTTYRLPPPNAVRGGGIPGIHQVWAMGPDETLILQHTAFNRNVFAAGALKAAAWLIDKKPGGLYDLSDLYKKLS